MATSDMSGSFGLGLRRSSISKTIIPALEWPCLSACAEVLKFFSEKHLLGSLAGPAGVLTHSKKMSNSVLGATSVPH
jgi:hypothetical protein